MTYRLIARTLFILFRDTFAKHFTPHQFGVATRGRCETMVHSVQVMIDLHPYWVVHKWMFGMPLIQCHGQ